MNTLYYGDRKLKKYTKENPRPIHEIGKESKRDLNDFRHLPLIQRILGSLDTNGFHKDSICVYEEENCTCSTCNMNREIQKCSGDKKIE